MRDFRQLEKKIIYTAAILFCLVLTSCWLTSNLYARYATKTSGDDHARVALFGQNESITLPENFINSLVPGDSNEYQITVSNYSSAGTSEVAQEYDVEVVTAGNLPLVYSLVQEDGTVIGSFKAGGSKKEHSFSAEQMKFGTSKPQSHIYRLKVEWPKNENASKWEEIPDFTEVRINVRQMD